MDKYLPEWKALQVHRNNIFEDIFENKPMPFGKQICIKVWYKFFTCGFSPFLIWCLDSCCFVFVKFHVTPWRNGSASDSRSEGCVFESRRAQIFSVYPSLVTYAPRFQFEGKILRPWVGSNHQPFG